MAQFDDPSIISLVTADTSTVVTNGETHTVPPAHDNAITKFLREAENKREKEESTESAELTTEQDDQPEFDNSNLHIEVEDHNLEYKDASILRYQPSELLRIRKECAIVVPEGLPSKSYYRFKSKLQQAQAYATSSSSNNTNYKSYNSRNYIDGTGSMGNFNLGKKYERNPHNRHSNSRRNRNNKKQDDESWLAGFDKDGPAGTAEDFEKWKARINNEERKKRAGNSKTEEEETPKNTIDNFFSLAKPSNKTASSQATQDVNKNSKFFSFFKPEGGAEPVREAQPAGQGNADGVSKILSFLGNGVNESGEQTSGSEQVPVQQRAPPPSQQSSIESSLPTASQFSETLSSQFNLNQNKSPGVSQENLSFPPGLVPNKGDSEGPRKVGGDSFFLSLMNKSEAKSDAPSEQKSQEREQESQRQQQTPQHPTSQKHTPQQPEQALQQPEQQQPVNQSNQASQNGQVQPSEQHIHSQHQQRPQFPPGFQGPLPGFPQRSQFPPGFNPNGPVPPPPGFNPAQQLPPWLASQQFPLHLQQFQGGIVPGQFPPGGPGNLPPPHLRGPPGQQIQGLQPQFYPQGVPDQQGFAPGFFNNLPPGFAPQPQHQQPQQQQQQQK